MLQQTAAMGLPLSKGPVVSCHPLAFFVYVSCMAFKTLTISEEAHQRLKKHKLPGESFTQVILRELPEPLETAGEVLDYLTSEPPARLDRRALETLRRGRGRRSNRR